MSDNPRGVPTDDPLVFHVVDDEPWGEDCATCGWCDRPNGRCRREEDGMAKGTTARLRELREEEVKRHERNEKALTKLLGPPGAVTKVELDADVTAQVEDVSWSIGHLSNEEMESMSERKLADAKETAMPSKANTSSKSKTSKPSYPAEFVKAVKAGVKAGKKFTEICQTIESKGIERPKGDIYNAVRAVAKAA